MECIQERIKNTATALMSRAGRNTDAVNACTITGQNGELPACFFTKEAERTYDRSIANFIRMHKG